MLIADNSEDVFSDQRCVPLFGKEKLLNCPEFNNVINNYSVNDNDNDNDSVNDNESVHDNAECQDFDQEKTNKAFELKEDAIIKINELHKLNNCTEIEKIRN